MGHACLHRIRVPKLRIALLSPTFSCHFRFCSFEILPSLRRDARILRRRGSTRGNPQLHTAHRQYAAPRGKAQDEIRHPPKAKRESTNEFHPGSHRGLPQARRQSPDCRAFLTQAGLTRPLQSSWALRGESACPEAGSWHWLSTCAACYSRITGKGHPWFPSSSPSSHPGAGQAGVARTAQCRPSPERLGVQMLSSGSG